MRQAACQELQGPCPPMSLSGPKKSTRRMLPCQENLLQLGCDFAHLGVWALGMHQTCRLPGVARGQGPCPQNASGWQARGPHVLAQVLLVSHQAGLAGSPGPPQWVCCPLGLPQQLPHQLHAQAVPATNSCLSCVPCCMADDSHSSKV